MTDFFCGVLGYTRPADGQPRYTISREKHVEVDGKYADAVLGDFNGNTVIWWRSKAKAPAIRSTAPSPGGACLPSIRNLGKCHVAMRTF